MESKVVIVDFAVQVTIPVALLLNDCLISVQVTPTDYTKDEPTKLPVWMLFAKGSIPSAELKLLFDEINTVREVSDLVFKVITTLPTVDSPATLSSTSLISE